MLENLEHQLLVFSQIVPLEIFTFFGALVEEVIAPIPSPIIMTTAGSIAFSQGRALIYLLVLALIGSLGKTIGAWILYFIADKGEDVILTRFGKFIGINHTHVEQIGKKLGNGWRDYVVLTGLRALPVMPSAPISVVCGILKIDLKTYLISTFAGTTLRNLLFIYLGYSSLSTFENIVHGFEKTESLIQIVLLVGVAGIIAFAYYKRHKSKKHNA